ncbi:MAG TPA: alpha-galactosidase [Candidatus Hydrogenedentes bacterium]|nr:alpha-galactosidase [Candidatus Hydrogenedentota bacterium]
MSVKIVLVGAGSRSFGPATVRDILLSDPLCEQRIDLVLMDKVADHLGEISEYARMVAAQLNRTVSIQTTTELESALKNARFVVTAIEVDRYLYWAQDFHIPRKHGFQQIYGENGGPGGLFHALRNMGPMVDIARAMERQCPDAWLLNFSNPEHKLCEAVSRLTSIRNVGLCHGVFMGLKQLSRLLNKSVEDLDAAACGINHFTWFSWVKDRATGADLYPQLRAAEAQGDWLHDWHELALARILFRRFGLWPSPAPNHYGEYIHWANEFYCGELEFFYDPVNGHPWQSGEAPEFVYSLSEHPTKRPWIKPAPALTRFDKAPLKPSGELAVPIMEGVACGMRQELPAINIQNRGIVPNLPERMVVEVPAIADDKELHPVPMPPLPEGIAAMIRLQGSIHQLLVEAYAEQSKEKLIQAFLLDPTCYSYRRAIECIDEMIALQQGLLPALH